MARVDGRPSKETGKSGVTEKIMRYLQNEVPHSMWWHLVGGPMQVRGMPDIQGVCYGQFIAIEAKAEGKDPTPLQMIRMRDLELSGAIVILARSVEDVKPVIERFLQTIPPMTSDIT